jgi:predicted GNAT superfamily acetyltransferase
MIMDVPSDLKPRHVQLGDYARVLAVIDEWWDGRLMSARLSHVFFSHFGPTSFVIEADGELAAFLLGFFSQSQEDEAYIHFVGVHPGLRRLGLGRSLYERFFAAARMQGRAWVRSITAPCNQASIAFHRGMGFVMDGGDGFVDGVPVRLDYAGDGGHRVVFHRRVVPDAWPVGPGAYNVMPASAAAAPPPHLVLPIAPPGLPVAREAPPVLSELSDCA